MVSRVYQPVYQQRPVDGRSSQSVAPSAEPAKTLPSSQADQFDGTTSERARPDLATLRDQAAGRRIRMESVLTDFETTLNALGIPEQTTQELQPYLNVVRLQGQEAKPNLALMKVTLLSASKSLDGFIAKATGKPSDVVEEWMQSLLAQDIDYHAVSPPKALVTANSAETSKPADSTTLTAIKQWVLAAKTQPPETAIPLLNQALQATEDPAIQARLTGMLAKRHWQLGQTQEATQHLSNSLRLQPDPDKQAIQRALLGSWYRKMGQPDQAADTLKPLMSENGLTPLKPLNQARAKLDYASAIIDVNTKTYATEAIPHLISGIKQGFAQKSWVKTALPTLASAYLAVGDTDNALKALNRYKQL